MSVCYAKFQELKIERCFYKLENMLSTRQKDKENVSLVGFSTRETI